MNKFELPEIEVIKFSVEDILTTSSGDNMLPVAPISDLSEDQLSITSMD